MMNNKDISIQTVNKEIQEILKRENLKLEPKLSFPMYRQLPDEVQLALKIVIKHGIKIIITIEPIKETK